MAPNARKESGNLGMSEQVVRRSSRVKHYNRQTEAGNDEGLGQQAPGSLWVAQQYQKKVESKPKQTAREQKQKPDIQPGQAKVRKAKISRPSKSQARKSSTLKQAEAKKRSESRQIKALPNISPLETRWRVQDRHQPRPATESQEQQVAEAPRPKSSKPRTGRPPAPSRLSRAALDQLQKETANDPLPEAIREFKSVLSDDGMAKTASRNTENVGKNKAISVYNQAFIVELKDRGILDHQFKQTGFDLKTPSNYRQIRNAIVKDRPRDHPSMAEYRDYTELAFSVSNEPDVGVIYPIFFGVPPKLRVPHLNAIDKRWNEHKPITGAIDLSSRSQAPQPDLAEGLDANEVPRWIREQLSEYSMPRAELAFPNYLVELKRDQSMFVGHVQNRHAGAIASQAFVEYYVQLHKDSSSAWDNARVGSIEFNGDIVVGNIHWVSSSDQSGQDPTIRKYHMTRAMCRFTHGLSYDDFKLARKEARNFREYFVRDRERFLKACKKMPRFHDEGQVSTGDEAGDDEDVESEEIEDEEKNDDSAIEGELGASERTNPKAIQSSEKRNDDQAAVKPRNETNKRRKSGRKTNNVQKGEATGL